MPGALTFTSRRLEKSTFAKVMCGRLLKRPLRISRKRFGFSAGETTRNLLLTNSYSRTYRTLETHERLTRACHHLAPEDPEALAIRAFGENHAASIMAKERNGWKPTTASLEDDIQKACVEHGHGGLWASMDYDTRDVVSIDMKSCYPVSFQGEGEARPYFQRFGHPSHRMARVAINGSLPQDIGTGFAQVSTWKFASDCHPVVPAWFGKHFDEKGWAPTQLLTYLVETGLLTSLEVTEAILSFKQQKEVWLPEAATRPVALSANSRRAARLTEGD